MLFPASLPFQTLSLDTLTSLQSEQRKDKKFIVPLPALASMFANLKKREFQLLTIQEEYIHEYLNSYFDTIHLDFYHQHHRDKPCRKKMRIREYNSTQQKYFEVKNRNFNFTSKQRELIENQEELNAKYAELHSLGYGVTLQNRYKRMTFYQIQNQEKLTIDFDLVSYLHERKIEMKEMAIVEIKMENERNSSMLPFFKQNKMRPQSMSKYCIGIASLYNVRKNYFLPTLRKLQLS